MTVVVEGGLDALKAVKESVKYGIPSVVVDGTRRAADILAFAHNNCECERQVKIRVVQSERRPNLLHLNSSPGTKRITVKWSLLVLFWSCSSQPYAFGFISCYLYLGDVLGERVRGCFPLYRTNRSETTRTNQGNWNQNSDRIDCWVLS